MSTVIGGGGDATLEGALERMRLDGAIFFRSEFTECWSYESPPAELAGLLRPGAERLIMFHVVARGTYWVSPPAARRGWLAALRDPVLAPALAELHRAPERHWTVAELAACAAVSRSLLDERFPAVLGRSPIRYLTEWRMHLAEELLASTRDGVAAVARQVGYDSEEAFSSAFKRDHGTSPSVWRLARRTAP